MTKSLMVGLVLAATFAACSTETAKPAENTKYNPDPVREIGGDRPAKVVLPSDYSVSERYPIVVLLHGYGANAGTQNLIFQLKERVDEKEFILVLPEGTRDQGGRQFWNAMPICCDFGVELVDDVAYLSGLLDEAEVLYAVDSARINFVGHSNGGYMSYRMACEVPERIHRIAVLAGSVFIDESDCKGKEPVSVLHMHGTADEIVPYAENFTDAPEGVLRVKTVGAEAAIDRWRAKAQCDAELVLAENIDVLSGRPGDETEVLRGKNCSEGTQIEFWRMNEGDHLALDANETFRDRVADFLLGAD